MRAVPFSSRLRQAIHAIDPELSRLVEAREHIREPIRAAFAQPSSLVQLTGQSVAVAEVLSAAVHAGDVG